MNSNFYILLLANIISKIGGALYSIVIITMVYEITESATLAAIVSLVRTIALIVSGLQISYFSERFPITKLISYLYLIQGAIVILILFQFQFISTGIVSLLLLYASEVAFQYAGGLISPLRNALVPHVVSEEHFLKANSMISSIEQSIGLASWLLGGIAVAFFHQIWILLFISIIFGLAAIVFLRIKLVQSDNLSINRKKQLFRFDGWVLIKKNPFLYRMLIVDTIEGIGTGIWIGGITLAYVKEVLMKNEAWWGYINGGYYVGTIIGASLLIILSSFINKRIHISMALGSFGVSVILLFFGLNHSAILSILLVILVGIFYQLRDSTQRTLIQNNVSKENLTTFYGFYGSINNIIFGLSVFIMGAIADLINASYIYIIGSIMSFITSLMIIKLFSLDRKKINDNTV